MSRKVTISIPDMLHEKLEKWRQSFNLSKMFQEALTEAIQKKEDFQKRIKEDLNVSEIIDRLKKEKLKSEGNYSDNGRLDGVEWAKTAHYDDLMYALDFKLPQAPTKDSILGDYFSDRINSDRLMDEEGNEYTTAYINGWKKGVIEFWDEIKDKL